MELKVNLDMVKKVGCKGALLYEYIRVKNFKDRGESKILYPEMMDFLGGDKTVTRTLRKLEAAGLIRIKKTNRGNFYLAV